jgi:GH25 family lysozyme M1 (1,4-beta-N-acetylmuramidase)
MILALADVSEFQGNIDWAAYGAANPAVVVRVHNSNRPDNFAQPNIAGARAHCSWRGWYQYLTASADPVKAAHDFQATLGPTLPGEVMILDLEEGAGDQRARRQAWLDALQDPVEWTYSGMYFARQRLPGVHVEWLAAYGQGEPTDSHTLWQNTNSRRFAGIPAPCDGSLFNGTLAQLQALTTPLSPLDSRKARTMYLIRTQAAPAIYVTDGMTKRWAGNAPALADALRLTGQTGPVIVSQEFLDSIPDQPAPGK